MPGTANELKINNEINNNSVDASIEGGMLDAAVVTAERNSSFNITASAEYHREEKLAPTKSSNNTINPDLNELNYDGYDTNAAHGKYYSPLDINRSGTGFIDGDINSLVFFPRYLVSDYSKDISNWRKQINPYGSKGFFYFKIYFNFHTNYGLLGGGVNNSGIADINTAYQYLTNIEDINLYKSLEMAEPITIDKFNNFNINEVYKNENEIKNNPDILNEIKDIKVDEFKNNDIKDNINLNEINEVQNNNKEEGIKEVIENEIKGKEENKTNEKIDSQSGQAFESTTSNV